MITLFILLERLSRSPLCRSTEQMHLDTHRYYAMMHSKGYELLAILQILPGNIFMRFIGEMNISLLLVDYSTLRPSDAGRLSLLLAEPNLRNTKISSAMNSNTSILEIYERLLDSND